MKILLLTPPFTQLNTPYPATAYLKGFLNTQNIKSVQADLGIEVILKIFSQQGLTKLFAVAEQSRSIEEKNEAFSANAGRILALKEDYISTINSVIEFLQNKKPTLAHLICNDDFLPESARFEQEIDLEHTFGTMGIQDKAKYLASLYLEDLSDFIVECVDEDFGFSRYAEKIALAANSFDQIYEKLRQKPTYVVEVLLDLLKEKLEADVFDIVAVSIPFPGNLMGALRIGQWLKANKPEIKIVFGGGYPNTELRSPAEKRIFEFTDFITLDDGELPLLLLLKYLKGEKEISELKRTFLLHESEIKYINACAEDYIKQKQTGTPDYSDFALSNYLQLIEIANPMHRLWNDGRWNKLTFAHGCYWGQCSFCDTSLDYIKRYDPNSAKVLADRVQQIVEKTGENGFHFVDEAAPPVLMREFALEIIRRRINIVWWTNVRFEQNYTLDLCRLLKQSGCIAVSGGLEVASDRLLKLINKGVTIEQVANVTRNFTESGIMVHAYLMYGFPTQTEQETIDSLEIVRQLFEVGIVHSAYWHQFSMTAHSPVGLNPEKFGVKAISDKLGAFANNDLPHIDPQGCNHEEFSFGLKKALYNFMHGVGFDFDIQEWFNFPVPATKEKADRIGKAIQISDESQKNMNKRVVWLGNSPLLRKYKKKKRGKTKEMAEILIRNKKEDVLLNVRAEFGEFIAFFLKKCSVYTENKITLNQLKKEFEARKLGDFEKFWSGYAISRLRQTALLLF